MGDAFCLKWNNHQTTLVSVFDKLFACESLVDCTLSAEGRQLKAHKVVLSACSPYLEDLIRNHEDKHPIIIFNSIRYDELKAMLEYMYRGEVNVSQEQLDSFLRVAESLKVKGLTDQGGGSNDTKYPKEDEKMSKKRKQRTSSSESSEEKEPERPFKPEPKSEPVDENNSGGPTEDLTMEEEEDFCPGPGTSQGSFSNQDFNNWPVVSEIANDEIFMAAQQDISNQSSTPQAEDQIVIERSGTLKRVHTFMHDVGRKRKKCTGCYKKLRLVLNSKEASTKVKKVRTYCDDCECKPALCLQCFNLKHTKLYYMT